MQRERAVPDLSLYGIFFSLHQFTLYHFQFIMQIIQSKGCYGYWIAHNALNRLIAISARCKKIICVVMGIGTGWYIFTTIVLGRMTLLDTNTPITHKNSLCAGVLSQIFTHWHFLYCFDYKCLISLFISWLICSQKVVCFINFHKISLSKLLTVWLLDDGLTLSSIKTQSDWT